MKRKLVPHVARFLCVLALSASMTTAALAADPSAPSQCYPTAVTRSEDGGEIRKMYDLGPEDDPAGIPRSDFEQDGCHYIHGGGKLRRCLPGKPLCGGPL